MEKQGNTVESNQEIIDSYLKRLIDSGGNSKELEKFVSDYVTLQRNASKVYSEITKGLLTQSHYSAEQVLSVYHSLQSELIDKSTVCEDMLNIVGNKDITREAIIEYFGVNPS